MQLAQLGLLGFTRGINPIPVPNQVTSRTAFLPFTRVGNDWQGRLNCQVNDLGEWVIIWTEGTQHSDPGPTTDRVNIAFSNDEGATWSDNNEDISGTPVTGFPLDPQSPAEFIGDFNFIKCANGDLVLICQERGTGTPAWNATNVTQSQYRSTDHGKTWAYELDFCTAIGEGASTATKGKIQGNYENMVVLDGTVYIILCQIRTDLDDTRIRLYKSTDHCATYSFVSNPVEYDEAANDCTESSIADLGNGKFFCIFRTQNLGNGVWKRSEDYGLTWGALTDFAPQLGYVGIHQPRVMKFSNFFMLMGRDNKPTPDNIYRHPRSAYWTTTDLFATGKRRYLDPFYAGFGGDDLSSGDSGYTRALQKSDGSFVFFGYWGLSSGALIYKYDVSHTNSPETEHYNNVNFFPSTIVTTGQRLQMNRDNVAVDTVASPVTGIGVATRAHNTLATGGTTWIGGGTNPPELIIVNDIGWCLFVNCHFIETVSTANTLFRNSFSIGFWMMPDDGQPAASQMLFRNSNSVTTALNDRIQILLQTDGRIQCGYAENAVAVNVSTANVIFANGAITTPVHVAATFTSGGLIRIYINGVLDANTGDISAITMANYTSAIFSTIGSRQTNTTTFDLPYTGKMREFIIQPVVWSAGDITNLMQN